MTKVLVFGASGLLGHTLCSLYPEETIPYTSADCDITDAVSVWLAIHNESPDVVVNCAGIVPKAEQDILALYKVNACGPKIISAVCDESGIRMIQISTDCVFSGKQGPYFEDSLPNPDTNYGMSKYLGEVTDYPHLTIRTSFVGLPDPKGHGLLAWLVSQKEVQGYTNVWWNGLTTVELSHTIMDLIQDWYYTGLLHIEGESISKYELLITVKEIYKLDVSITPANTPRSNKVLFSDQYAPISKSFKQMVEEMKKLEGVLCL